jgi:broad specificity phosphatase PhoE
MTYLCMVRHGQTDWNLEGRYQGQSDIPLNDTGQAQALKLVRQLEGCSFMAIYTSDLLRAKETAATLAASRHLPVIADPRLREINQGEWEGQFVDVIKARYSQLWQERSKDPANVRPPGGETVREVADRVYAALDEIAVRYPAGPVLVISHGLALATVICRIHKISLGQAYNNIPDNAVPIWLHWHPDDGF